LVALGDGLVVANGVALVDVTPRLESVGIERVLDFMKASPDGFESPDAAAHAVAEYRNKERRDGDAEGLLRYLREGVDGRWYWHWDPQLLESVGLRVSDHHAQLIAAASNIKVPVLVVRGANSDVVGDEGVDELLEVCATARVVTVDDAGHLVASDDASVFAGVIRRFVSEQLGPPSSPEQSP
jgi:pimeloyl-ACP methyl ester carboxylesterase